VGLIRSIVGLPTAPLRGVIAAAEQVHQHAEREFYDPANIRRELDEVERQRADGLLTDDEAAAWEDELVERLLVARERSRGEQ
jgi:cytochrome c-type biogenesis protein CcmH/NrfG